MRSRHLAAVGLALVAACLGGETDRPLGRRCTADAECEGLLCQYGRCRGECAFDRDCHEGGVCVASTSDPSLRVCTLSDEAGCIEENACEAPLVCDMTDSVCRDGCHEENSPCEPPRICRDGVCIEDCAEAETCNGFDDDCDGDIDEEEGGPLCETGVACESGRCGSPGELAWDAVFLGPGPTLALDVDFAPDGSVVVVGDCVDSIDLGEGPEPCSGERDGFVVALDAEGSHLWHHVITGPGEVRATGVAVDSQGQVVISGHFDGTADLAGTTLTDDGGERDVFVAAFTPAGDFLWHEILASSGNDYASDVDVGPEDEIIVVGYGHAALRTPDEILLWAAQSDAFAVRFSAEGDYLDGLSLTGDGADQARAVTATADGGYIVAGWFSADLTIGTSTIRNLGSSGTDGFAVTVGALGTPRTTFQVGLRITRWRAQRLWRLRGRRRRHRRVPHLGRRRGRLRNGVSRRGEP